MASIWGNGSAFNTAAMGSSTAATTASSSNTISSNSNKNSDNSREYSLFDWIGTGDDGSTSSWPSSSSSSYLDQLLNTSSSSSSSSATDDWLFPVAFKFDTPEDDPTSALIQHAMVEDEAKLAQLQEEANQIQALLLGQLSNLTSPSSHQQPQSQHQQQNPSTTQPTVTPNNNQHTPTTLGDNTNTHNRSVVAAGKLPSHLSQADPTQLLSQQTALAAAAMIAQSITSANFANQRQTTTMPQTLELQRIKEQAALSLASLSSPSLPSMSLQHSTSGIVSPPLQQVTPIHQQPTPPPTKKRKSAAASVASTPVMLSQTPPVSSFSPNAPSLEFGDGEEEDMDDKRKRNLAASARFRAKKKMKEQALQQTATEMVTKVDYLEKRLRDYEMEIRWLRHLLAEQGSQKRLREVYEENNIPFPSVFVPAPAESTPPVAPVRPMVTGLPPLVPRPIMPAGPRQL